MRKMIITGVTSGIGKALREKYDGNYLAKYKDLIEVEGHSRRYNKHDIEHIKEWFDPKGDIFINNAYNDYKWWAQTQALLFVFHLWKDDPNKHIISVSSIASEKDTDDYPIGHSRYTAGKISLDKINLECYEKTAKHNGCKISLLRPGWVETPRTTRLATLVNRVYDHKLEPNMLSPEQCVECIDHMINFSGRIREMTIEAE